MQTTQLRGMEINPKLVGAIFTDTTEDAMRVFCVYVTGDTYEFEVPVEENRASIHALFAELDMLDKCDSAIAESAVQGRLYAQDEKGCWMYTLLATTGSSAPRLDSRIHHLRWKRVWSAKGTDVLRLGQRSQKRYCYAVRTEITEDHLQQALKHSSAFVQPVPPPAPRTIPLATLTALLIAGLGFGGGAAWFHLRGKAPTVVHARPLAAQPAAPKAAVVPPAPAEAKYYVLADGKIAGPHPMVAVLEQQRTGAVTAETLVRREGELDWRRLEDALSPDTAD